MRRATPPSDPQDPKGQLSLAFQTSGSRRRRPRTIARYRLALVREESTEYDPPPDCSRPAVAVEVVRRLLAGGVREGGAEVVGALLLDGRNRAIGHQIVPNGCGRGLVIEPRTLLVPALLANAASILVFRCRAVRDPLVDAEDIRLSKRIAEAGDLLGVRMTDYLLLGSGLGFLSLHERRMLQ